MVSAALASQASPVSKQRTTELTNLNAFLGVAFTANAPACLTLMTRLRLVARPAG